MFGTDAVQRLKQNRALSRRVNERNFKKTDQHTIRPHSPRAMADKAYLEEVAKDTRQRNRKEDIASMLIVITFLGIMIFLFMYMVNR